MGKRTREGSPVLQKETSQEEIESMTSLPGNDEVRAFMDELTASGCRNYVSLPMIAVMGDTSSGKSSLLSGISMVELPSCSSITTRCPVMLHMRQADILEAVVSVQWNNATGDEEQFSREVSAEEWRTLPAVISEAQALIIDSTGKEVADDIVVVKIGGPGYHDLTLIDLPGIVRSVGDKENQSLVNEVAELTKSYLDNERCVVLAVVPANVEYHNAQIIADAKKVDPKTSRTIPVITKPDLIDNGGENEVLDLLMGEKISFDMGFHISKGRGQKALDDKQTIQRAISQEEHYFNTTKPWCDVSQRDMFGVQSLRRKLGELQMRMVRDTVPAIMKEVTDKYKASSAALTSLGPMLQTGLEKRIKYGDFTKAVCAELKVSFTGKSTDAPVGTALASATPELYEAFDRFKCSVLEGTLVNIHTIKKDSRVIVIDGNKKGVVTKMNTSSPSADVQIDGGDEESFELTDIRRDPQWLQDLMYQSRTDDLPCFLNAQTFNDIVMKFIEDEWRVPCEVLVQETRDIIEKNAAECVKRRQSSYTNLCGFLSVTCEEALHTAVQIAEEEVRHFLEMEQRPYTQDSEMFRSLSKNRTKHLEEDIMRTLNRMDGNQEPDVVKKVCDTARYIVFHTMFQVIEGHFKLHGNQSIETHMSEEMEFIIESHGKIISSRLMDKIPMICWKMCNTVIAEIEGSMTKITDDTLDRLFQQTPAFTRNHRDLVVKTGELQNALSIFKKMRTGGYSGKK